MSRERVKMYFMRKKTKFINPKYKQKQKKGNNFKNASIWEELPKIANLKNRPMGLSKDDEIIYD